MSEMKEKTVTKEIEVRLTHIEIAEKAKLAGDLKLEIAEKDKEFKTVKDKHNSEVKELAERREQLLDVAHAGRERRTESVTERFLYNACEVKTFYKGEEVDSRAMTHDELNEYQEPELPLTMGGEDDEEEAAPADDEAKSADEQIADDIRESTSRRTASSALDGGKH
jgi:hypothetical protein